MYRPRPGTPKRRLPPSQLPAGSPVSAQDRGLGGVIAGAIWIMVIFMIVPEGFNYVSLRDVDVMPASGSAFSRITWLSLLGTGGLVVASRMEMTKRLLKSVNVFLLMWICLAGLSVIWSVDSGVTIRRMIRVMTVFFIGMAFMMVAWHPRRFQSVLRPVITLMLVGSIVFGIVSPDLAIEQGTYAQLVGAWKGLALQKNSLGSLASFGVLLWMHAWLTKESKLIWILIGGGASFACVFLSRSSTALMATLFSMMLLLLLLRSPPQMKRYMPYVIGLFAFILVVYSLAMLRLVPGLDFVLKPVAMLTGKDLTFSGRTDIWTIVNERIAQHPWLGGGYGAYWTGGLPGTQSYEFKVRMYFYPSQGHNGYLDVINDLGIFGGICLIGYIMRFIVQSLQLFRVDRAQGTLFLAFVFHQLLANLSESRWFSSLTLEFALMTFATIAVARDLMHRQSIQVAQRFQSFAPQRRSPNAR